MGENENWDVRRIIANMPRSSDGLRGQQRDSATKVEALALQSAICGALDVLDLFDEGGRVVLVANGELQAINAKYLRVILESLFATKAVVRKLPGLKYEVEYRPINPSEAAVRALLRADQRDGGLLGRLPVLVVETQGFAALSLAPPAAPGLPDDHPEVLASRRTQTRYADSDARRELEIARGREVGERYRLRQQAAAVDPSTKPQELIVEKYPVFAPPESKAAEDATEPPQV
jgi:hypothetical protein